MTYRTIPPLVILILLIPPVLTACTNRSADTAWTIEERNGIVTRVYRSADPPELDPYRLEPGAIFGTDQSEATYLWRYASPVAELPDGGLLAFGGRNETGLVQRFAPDGRYIDSFGRSGEGPGELRGVGNVFFTADELIVVDSANRRLSRFSRSGSYLEQQRFPPDLSGSLTLRLLPRSRGHFCLVALDGRGLSTTADETVFGWEFLIQSLDSELQPITTHLDSIYEQTWFIVDNHYLAPPLARDAPVDFASAPYLPVAWVERDDYTIQFLDPDSGERSALYLPHSPVAVTAELRSRWRDQHVDEGWSEEGLNRLRLPPVLPAIRDLQWDGAGRLWVQDYTAGYAVGEPTGFWFNVFDAEGVWLFRQHLPDNPSFFGREGVYFTGQAGDGTPIIRYYQLVRISPGS